MENENIWRYCVVGNIVKSHIDDAGILHYGSSAFVGGTKVYLSGRLWSPAQDKISVIGLNRFKRYEVEYIPVSLIENVRCQKVYKSSILALMDDFEFSDCWWGNTKEEKTSTEQFVEVWKREIAPRFAPVSGNPSRKAFYSYSVKKLLCGHFGANPISTMRLTREDCLDESSQKNILPLRWQYADQQAQELFLSEYFLLETIVEDDYIVYIGQRGSEKVAFLMFMITEDAVPFALDVEYAKELVAEWGRKGYLVLFCSVCVGEEWYGNQPRFRFVQHLTTEKGTHLYNLESVAGHDFMKFKAHPCWDTIYRNFVAVSETNDQREYECLFEDEVQLTTGADKEKTVLSVGIPELRKYLADKTISTAFYRTGNTQFYTQILLADDSEIIIYVNRRNLICEVNVGAATLDKERLMPVDAKPVKSLVGMIPHLDHVVALDPVQMHGLVLQLSYGDGTIRNYYLKCFETPGVPQSVKVGEWRTITVKDFMTATLNGNTGVKFCNGLTIPAHQLYYRSYRQLQSERTGRMVYADEHLTIRSEYRIPLLEFKDHFSWQQHWGQPNECYGPARTFFDNKGNRLTNISFYTAYDPEYGLGAKRISVEASTLWGYIKEDGAWLIPPIYSETKTFSQGCVSAIRKVDGKDVKFLVTEDGKEREFPFEIDTEDFWGDRCPFNTATWKGPRPNAGYYWDFEISPGNWGFIDLDGNIVVEPQYVYAIGFYNGDGHHSIVAKMVDGELRWGAIDINGVETIPCQYIELYTRWGDAVAFKEEKNGDYGIMDFNGRVIVPPRFGYFEAYDEKHGLLTVGDDEDSLGVYSIEQGRFITPQDYDCVDYYEKIIACEVKWTSKEHYFSYDGRRLDFGDFSSVFEAKEGLIAWKDGKAGLIDWDGTVIIPPVMDSGMENHIELYRKGFVITSQRKKRGLSRVSGEVILPEVYSEVVLYDGMLIASRRVDGNWCINDTLVSYEGKPFLEGAYRNMRYKEKEHILVAETPLGREVFTITFIEQHHNATEQTGREE